MCMCTFVHSLLHTCTVFGCTAANLVTGGRSSPCVDTSGNSLLLGCKGTQDQSALAIREMCYCVGRTGRACCLHDVGAGAIGLVKVKGAGVTGLDKGRCPLLSSFWSVRALHIQCSARDDRASQHNKKQGIAV